MQRACLNEQNIALLVISCERCSRIPVRIHACANANARASIYLVTWRNWRRRALRTKPNGIPSLKSRNTLRSAIPRFHHRRESFGETTRISMVCILAENVNVKRRSRVFESSVRQATRVARSTHRRGIRAVTRHWTDAHGGLDETKRIN